MISILIPTIRPENIPLLIETIDKNTDIPHEIIWEEDTHRIGCPKMLKMLVEKAKYEWVVFLGDDTLPGPGCIDNAYEKAIREGLWLVGFNDHDTERATHWLANKALLDHLDGHEFFHTGYLHNFCDDELRVRTDKMGKYGWCYESRIQHEHPAFTGKEDSTYDEQRDPKNYERDRALFWERNPEHKNYGA
jgi:hypothetical protein